MRLALQIILGAVQVLLLSLAPSRQSISYDFINFCKDLSWKSDIRNGTCLATFTIFYEVLASIQ